VVIRKGIERRGYERVRWRVEKPERARSHFEGFADVRANPDRRNVSRARGRLQQADGAEHRAQGRVRERQAATGAPRAELEPDPEGREGRSELPQRSAI